MPIVAWLGCQHADRLVSVVGLSARLYKVNAHTCWHVSYFISGMGLKWDESLAGKTGGTCERACKRERERERERERD